MTARAPGVAARTGPGFALLLDHLDPDSAIETAERVTRFIASPAARHRQRRGRDRCGRRRGDHPAGDTAQDVLVRAERNLERVKEF